MPDISPDWVPPWVISVVIFAVVALVALIIHRIIFRLLTRFVSEQSLFLRTLLSRLEGPMRLALVILALSASTNLAPLSREGIELVRHGLLVAFITLAGWAAQIALHLWAIIHLRRFKQGSEDDLLARKHVTQSRILERIASILIGVITISAALMTFDAVRQYGVSLFASAGIAGIVLGIALQPSLKNLIAGVQIAVTQPIRINDAVIVENEWGHIEEITSSYVVIKLWDLRRLIVPLSYFLEKPFQNWTRDQMSLIGTVFLYTDFTVPPEVLRRKLDEILHVSALWDREVAAVQVTDFKQETMEIRMLVSAADAGKVFDLRCEVREKMIAFLQSEYPGSLPRRRVEVVRDSSASETQAEPAEAERGARSRAFTLSRGAGG